MYWLRDKSGKRTNCENHKDAEEMVKHCGYTWDAVTAKPPEPDPVAEQEAAEERPARRK